MNEQTGLQELVAEITNALTAVPHDRWQLSWLNQGRLWIIADKRRPSLAPGARCTRLTSLGRACIFDRCPVTVNNVFPPEASVPMRDWEMDWPSLVYIPVASPRRRPNGLLVIGSRRQQWYESSELTFLSDLGEVVAPWLRRFVVAQRIGQRRRAA